MPDVSRRWKGLDKAARLWHHPLVLNFELQRGKAIPMRWCIVCLAGVATLLLALSAEAEDAAQPSEPTAPETTPTETEGAEGEGESPETEPETPEPETEPEPETPEPETEPEPGTPEPETEPEPGTPEPAPETPEPAPETPEPVTEPPSTEVPTLPPPQVEAPQARRSVTFVQPELQEPGEEEEETVLEAEVEDDERVRHGAEETWSDALPFRGTSIIYENIFNVTQMSRDNELTYNPYYAMSLSLRPRWYFTDNLSIRLRFDLEWELTNADDTKNYHETRVGDLYVDLLYNPVFNIPVLDIDVGLGMRLQFPTSLQSQYETRYLGMGPDLRLARIFNVLDGLVIGYKFSYMKYLNRYTTTELDSHPLGGGCPSNDIGCQALVQGGEAARSHGFFNQFTFEINFARRVRPMAIGFMVLFLNYLTYELPESEVEIMGGQDVTVDHIDDPQRQQASMWFVLDYSIELTDYLIASVGFSTLYPQLQPDSTYRTPFFNRYTNIYIDLTLDLERLVAAVRR